MDRTVTNTYGCQHRSSGEHVQIKVEETEQQLRNRRIEELRRLFPFFAAQNILRWQVISIQTIDRMPRVPFTIRLEIVRIHKVRALQHRDEADALQVKYHEVQPAVTGKRAVGRGGDAVLFGE